MTSITCFLLVIAAGTAMLVHCCCRKCRGDCRKRRGSCAAAAATAAEALDIEAPLLNPLQREKHMRRHDPYRVEVAAAHAVPAAAAAGFVMLQHHVPLKGGQ